MKLRIFWDFLKMEITDSYPSVWAWTGMFVGTVFSMLIYWFTSKAFSPIVSSFVAEQGMSYFLFVISGEIILMLPILLLEAPAHVVKQATAYGTLTSMMQLPCGHSTPILYWSIAKVPVEIIRLISTVLIISILFGMIAPVGWVLKIFLLALAISPSFLGLGLIASALVVAFGRGEKILTFAINITTIFSGIYFPTHVLPKSLETIIQSGSPFYFILQRTRDLISNRINYLLTINEFFVVLVCDLVFMILGIGLLLLSFEYTKSRGLSLLIRY